MHIFTKAQVVTTTALANYYTSAVTDTMFKTTVTPDYLGNYFVQKFLVMHPAGSSSFYHCLSIEILAISLSDGGTLRMDLSMVKDKEGLYGETLHTIFFRASDHQFQIVSGVGVYCDCVQYVTCRNDGAPMPIYFSQDTNIKSGTSTATWHPGLYWGLTSGTAWRA